MWGPWLFAALYFPALQVLPLYLFYRRPRSEAIYQRMAATTVAAGAAGWLPTARRLAAAGAASGQAPPRLAAALGLRAPGLAAACVLPLALTALLFAGPLLALALSRRARGALWAQRVSGLPLAARLRNWVAAPLLEEFLFRGCLCSYLLASGASPAGCAVLSPLLFAACHLHHLHDLLRFQRLSPRAAFCQVAFQFAYTTLFGMLASFYFVRTHHLAAAVLPHALCNVLGPPSLPPKGAPHRRAVAAALAAGVLGFLCLLLPSTDPRLYKNVR